MPMKRLWLLLPGLLALAACATSPGSLARHAADQEKKESSLAQLELLEKAPKPPARKGLEIHSQPDDAEVYLDGRYKGLTPLLLGDIPKGRYLLSIQKEGYYPETTWIDFYGDYLWFEAELRLITGFLRVETSPARAEILLGSQTLASGSTAEVPVGSYWLRVRAFAYKEYTARVEIREKALLSLEVRLEEAVFDLSELKASRERFNPRNPGALGRTEVSFRVSSAGSGWASVRHELGEEVYRRSFDSFTDWRQSFAWNGRDADGSPLADGGYTVRVEAVPDRIPEQGPGVWSQEVNVVLDSGLRLDFRSLWHGGSGLLYAPSAEVLPEGGSQFSTLILGHLETSGGETRFSAPWNLGLRLGLGSGLELDAQAGITIGQYRDETEAVDFLPLFASAALKRSLLKGRGRTEAEVSALVKVAYRNVSTDTQANFTGLSLGLPADLGMGPLRFMVCPEIIAAAGRVSYDPAESPDSALRLWAYGRTGLLLELEPLSIGLSASFRSAPFSSGFYLELPFQAALEVHYLVPRSQLFLTFTLAGEFSAANNYYLLCGGGLGLLD